MNETCKTCETSAATVWVLGHGFCNECTEDQVLSLLQTTHEDATRITELRRERDRLMATVARRDKAIDAWQAHAADVARTRDEYEAERDQAKEQVTELVRQCQELKRARDDLMFRAQFPTELIAEDIPADGDCVL